MSNEVIWYDSSETGAPVLNNVAGAMLAVLDACLLNGFNVKSVTSIVVASNVATVTCTAHGYSPVFAKLVRIEGALPAGLNGRKQITSTGVNSFTFPTTGISDQTATGTIAARRAPLETWEKPYSGTNKAMYRSTDLGATGALLRVVDTLSGEGTASAARVRMVETAADVDTFTGSCPTDAQLSGGGFWFRGANTVTAKTWRLVGDGRFFWFFVQMGTGADHACYYFGDFLSYKAADSSAAIIGYTYGDLGGATSAYSYALELATSPVSVGSYTNGQMLRGNNGITGSTPMMLVPSTAGLGSTTLGRSGATYPSPVDGGFVIAYPNDFIEGAQGFRGRMPGLALTPMNISSVPDLTIFSGLQNSSRVFLTVYANHVNQSVIVLIDLTGPWR